MVSGYLHAPADGVNGGNGLYKYGALSGFPGNSYNGTNYWVDVSFTQALPDITAPALVSSTPTNNTNGVTPSAQITAIFNEAVDSSTITFEVRDAFNTIVPGNMSYNPATHVATFIPSVPLISFMTYTVTVSGATDLSGNTMSVPVAWSFRTRGIWLQTTAADFNSGTNNGTKVTNDFGGAVTLAPLLEEEFNGNELSTENWTVSSWASDGGGTQVATVADGVLTTGGSGILSVQSFTDTALEGRVQFGASAYQHFGLATNLNAAIGNYWAIFSTKGTTDRLFARVNANGSATEVDLGARPVGYHTFKIIPVDTGFEFYIDGVLQTTIAASFQSTVPMKAGMSDYLSTAGQLIQAEWISFKSFSTIQSGTYTSSIFDAGEQVTWDTISVSASVPVGTTLSVSVQVGTLQADGSILWQLAIPATDGKLRDINGNVIVGQFLQYSVTMSTSDSTQTPRLDEISFTWM